VYVLASLPCKVLHLTISVMMIQVELLYKPPLQLHGSVVVIYFLIKCVYWYYSAKQICFGYKLFSQDNYWTKRDPLSRTADEKVSYYRYIGFSLYSLCPFLFEIRTLLDWGCSATALTFFEWFKLEDINRQLFLNRQSRALDRDSADGGRKEGDKQEVWVRVLAGGSIVFGLVLALWGPLFIFSGAFPNSEADSVTLSSAALNLYFSDSDQNTISTKLWSFPNMLKVEDVQNYSTSPTVSSRYTQQCLGLPSASSTNWNPTTPQINLIDEYTKKCEADEGHTYVTLTYQLITEIKQYQKRVELNEPGAKPKKGILTADNCYQLSETLLEWQNNTCNKTLKWKSSQPINISNANAADIVLPRGKQVGTVDTFSKCGNSDVNCALQLTLYQEWVQSGWCASWWQVTQSKDASQVAPYVNVLTDSELTGFVALIEGSGGLVFLYGTVVLLIGRAIRSLFGNQQELIIFEDMQDCQDPSDMCMAIYIARNQGRLKEEEQNYRALIQLYRNPGTLFNRTRWKEQDFSAEDSWYTRRTLEKQKTE